MDIQLRSTDRPTAQRRHRWMPLRAAAAAVLLACVADASALGFGEVQLASRLGERLHARIPLVGDDAARVSGECVRLIPGAVLQDAPALTGARAFLDRNGRGPAVIVTTFAPVQEPAVSFVVELGCTESFRREFVLLIDPPELPAATVEAPAVASPLVVRVAPTPESRWPSAAPERAPERAPDFATGAPTEPLRAPGAVASAPVAERVTRAPRPARPAPAARKATPPRSGGTTASPAPAKAPAPAPARDRLVLADVDPAATAPATPAAPPVAPAADEARAAREEALQRQLEALAREMTRMREDMDKLAVRNRELAQEATIGRSGWFAAAGLGIVLIGIGIGTLGRRQSANWLDALRPSGRGRAPDAGADAWSRDEVLATGFDRVAPGNTAFATARKPAGDAAMPLDMITDLDVTKLDVREDDRHAVAETAALRGAAARATPTGVDGVAARDDGWDKVPAATGFGTTLARVDFELEAPPQPPTGTAWSPAPADAALPPVELPPLDFSTEIAAHSTQRTPVLPINPKLLPPLFPDTEPAATRADDEHAPTMVFDETTPLADTVPLEDDTPPDRSAKRA